MSETIASALLNIGGVRFQPDDPITFKSGIVSPVYCDNRRFPFHPREWREVIVDLNGEEGVSVSLSESFWGRCPELRSAAIGRWLLRNGLAPWSRGAPPSALLLADGSNRFSLRPLS